MSAVSRRIDPAGTKPLLLIDVDGVLNAMSKTLREAVKRGKRAPWQMHILGGWHVLLNPEHGIALRELEEHFELAWATSWEHEANALIGPQIGLPDLPVITFGLGEADEERPSMATGYSGWTWKVPWVDAACGRRPLVWLDDELGRDAREWAKRRTRDGAPTKLIEIDPVHGLKPEHLATALAWAESLEG